MKAGNDNVEFTAWKIFMTAANLPKQAATFSASFSEEIRLAKSYH
jgi:hypothetical protein